MLLLTFIPSIDVSAKRVCSKPHIKSKKSIGQKIQAFHETRTLNTQFHPSKKCKTKCRAVLYFFFRLCYSFVCVLYSVYLTCANNLRASSIKVNSIVLCGCDDDRTETNYCYVCEKLQNMTKYLAMVFTCK